MRGLGPAALTAAVVSAAEARRDHLALHGDTVHFYDFGTPVTIEVPAPDQLVTSDEVTTLLENFTVDEEASA